MLELGRRKGYSVDRGQVRRRRAKDEREKRRFNPNTSHRRHRKKCAKLNGVVERGEYGYAVG
jgi:hypothetical protein